MDDVGRVRGGYDDSWVYLGSSESEGSSAVVCSNQQIIDGGNTLALANDCTLRPSTCMGGRLSRWLPMYTALLAHIARYVALTPAEAQLLGDHLTLQTVPRKAYLLAAGQTCTASFFVLKGCLRMYFITEKGTEQITRFALENWWLTDHASLLSQRPAQSFMQAVEPTTVAVLDHARQEELLAQVPALERYFRLVLERVVAADQMRFVYQFGLSAEERYHHFSSAFPGFVQRVPQYMLASYLGFTPEFLSKIRARPGGHSAGKAGPHEP